MLHHDMNFLPQDFVDRCRARQMQRWCAAACGGVMVVVAIAFGILSFSAVDVRERRAAIDEAYVVAAKELQELQALQSRKAELIRKAKRAAILREPVPRSFILADLIQRMPDQVSMMRLNLASATVRPPVPVVSKSAFAKRKNKKNKKGEADEEHVMPRMEVSLVMEGIAPTDVDVAQYMSALKNSPLLKSVELSFTKEIRVGVSGMQRHFRIAMKIHPEVDVRLMDRLQADHTRAAKGAEEVLARLEHRGQERRSR